MINLIIIYKKKLLSICLIKKKYIFYKEIIGNYINSKYTISLINETLIKNNLSLKNISYINFFYNKKNLTGFKILITIIQIISITKSVPVLINQKIKKNIIKKIFYNSVKYHNNHLIPNSNFIKN